MTTSRIAPLPPDRASLLTRLMYRYAKHRFGEVPEPFAVAAHHPRLLMANAAHEGLLQIGLEAAAPSVRELAVFWTAQNHRMLVVRGLRLDAAEARRPRRRSAAPHRRLRDISGLYATNERAAITYADAMTTDPHTVTDEQVADLRRGSATRASWNSPIRSAWRTCGPGCTRRWVSPSRASPRRLPGPLGDVQARRGEHPHVPQAPERHAQPDDSALGPDAMAAMATLESLESSPIT